MTLHLPKDGGNAQIVDQRELTDAENVVVTYHNPLDNVPDLARHFFTRCLEVKKPQPPHPSHPPPPTSHP